MNKLLQKLAKISLGLSMAAGVGVAVASGGKNLESVNAGSATYTEKAGTSLAAGDEVLIVASPTSGTTKYYVPVSTSYTGSAISNSSTVTIINSIDDSHLWTVEKNSSSYAFKFTSGNSTYYLTVSGTGTGNKTRISTTTTYKNWNITSATNGYSMQNATTNNYFGVYTSGSDWRVYASATQANFGGTGVGIRFYTKDSTKTLSSISVSTAPTKTTYYAGDYFDPTGLVITRTYSDSTSDTYAYAGHTSEFTFTPSTSTALTQSDASVTISYGGKSTSQAITVNAARTLSSISVNTAPTKVTYSEGEYFDPTGLVIGRTFSDSSSDTYTYANHTSEFTFSPSTSTALSTSDTSVTITYDGKSTTQAITVSEVTKYELISDASGLKSGSNYLIGAYSSSTYRFMSTTQNSNNRGHHVLVGSVTNNKVGYEDGMEVVTLGGSSNDGWTLYANNSDTAGYLYLPSNSNYLRTRASSFTWGISFSDGVPSISATVTNERFIKYNSGNNPPIFSCYQSGQTNISLWKEVSTAESIAISKDSTSGFKGDSDNTISITASNFTPTNIEVSYSTSGVASVTKGTISEGVIPLTVSYTGVGDTTATITVKGGTTDYSVDLDISVEAKPSVLRVVESRSANPLVDITSIEIENGDSTGRSFTKLNIYVEDTDGNAIEIGTISDYVTLSRISGDDCVTISGGKITGKAVGTAVVKFELNSLTSVYDTVTVSVSDDYKDSVNSITFNSNLTDTQGDPVDSSAVFATKVANTHFGSTETIADSELLFSYENNRSGAEAIGIFSYDFSHGTTVDSTHKSQTVYVFTTFDSSYSGSFTITVEQKNDPLTAITITNVTSNAKELARGDSFQLEIAYTPTNPTDGKEVTYRVDDSDAGVSVSVNSSGLISVAASSGLGDALVVVESSHDATIYDYVYVSVVLESMTYIVRETESWDLVDDISTLEAGDQVILTGVKNSVTYAASVWAGGNNVPADTENTLTVSNSSVTGVVSTMIYTLEEGTATGSVAFKGSDGNYLCSCSSGSNYMHSQATINDAASWILNSDGTVVAQGTYTRNYMRYNNSSTSNLFACYASTGTTGTLVTFYKKNGGDTPYTVTEALFNGVQNNFGSDKTYEWSESCPAFDSEAWEDACEALMGITGYSTYKLNRAVGNISGNEIEVFIAKYDNIITKFSTAYDYLGRYASGGINYGLRVNVNPLSNIIGENTNTVAIIVIISMVSVTAIGGYFFLRKRKENI